MNVLVVDTGDCGACLNEVKQLNNPYYNMHRLGFFITPTPRQADVLLVVGPLTDHMRLPLRKTYDAMPTPKRVIAVGTVRAVGRGVRAQLCLRDRPRRSAARGRGRSGQSSPAAGHPSRVARGGGTKISRFASSRPPRMPPRRRQPDESMRIADRFVRGALRRGRRVDGDSPAETRPPGTGLGRHAGVAGPDWGKRLDPDDRKRLRHAAVGGAVVRHAAVADGPSLGPLRC